MFDFLKSLFGVQEKKRPAKETVVKDARSKIASKTNNSTIKKTDTVKADIVNKPNEKLFVNEIDGKYGYVNTKGEQIIECEFDSVGDFREGLAAVEKDGKWGYINTKGEQIIECELEWNGGFSEGLARVLKDGQWGYINTKGEWVIECKFGYAHDFKKGLAEVMKDGQWVVINTKGNFIVFDEDNNQIEVIKEVSDKSGNVFLLSNSDGKFGLLDANYNALIKNKLYGEFEVVQRMNENTFLIKMAEKEFFIDSNGDFK